MGKPEKEHWQAMKCIFNYLKGTTDIRLVYQSDTSYAFVGYSDSDYVVDLDAKRSVIGYAFPNGNTLASWKATLHSKVSLSIIEA